MATVKVTLVKSLNGRLANHDSFDVVAGDWLTEHKLN